MSTKVDRGMKQFIDEQAEQKAVSRAEAMRRMLDTYREVHHARLECPGCGSAVGVRMDG